MEGIHEPIISRDLWDQAQEIITHRYHPPYNNGTPRSPLAGILHCRVCGRAMVRMPFHAKEKNGVDNLICPTRGCCAATRLDRVETAVLEGLRSHLEVFRAQLVSLDVSRAEDYARAAETIRRELATLHKQMDRLHDLLEQGVYDIETFLERSASIKEKTGELERALTQTEDQAKRDSVEHLRERVERIEAGLSVYDGSDIPGRNRILKNLIENGTYYKEKGWKPTKFDIELTLK